MTTAHLRRRLAELEAQIVEQRLVLDELEQNRSVTQDELRATATYPVSTLPFEITANIFVHCVWDPFSASVVHPSSSCSFSSSSSTSDDNPDSNEDSMGHELRTTAPLLLLGVCRAWRDIALNTPMLWSRLNSVSTPSPIELLRRQA
ncbi:hypothetical protein DFH09DRAFT_493565 [Mycena vulgaris]|nr:hypothetical protein DFH09DRAFT_493565 [Mycena vulgaris]